MASGLVPPGFPAPGFAVTRRSAGRSRLQAAGRTREGRCQTAGPQFSDAERLARAPTAVERRSRRVDMPGVVRILSLLLVSLLLGTARGLRVSP